APPKNVEKALLTWFRCSRARTVPLYMLSEFRELYPNREIEFYAHGSVGAVIAGGNVSLFLPLDVVQGARVATAEDGRTKTIPPDVKGVRQWARTKMGYIPIEGRVAYLVMRKRSIGEFARPSLGGGR